MRVIITGATGGLGRNLVLHVKELGWDILALGRNKSIGTALGVPFVSVDLCDALMTREAFRSADIVFHCAALSSPWGSYEMFYNANVRATQNVIDAMLYHGIPKIVHVSTSSIYFNYKDQLNVKEECRAKRFVNNYAQTKYEAEIVILQSEINSVIIRPRGIFGEYDQALFPRLERIAQKGFLPLIKNKNALVDITYVGNVVYALYLAASQDIPSKSIFNITNDEPKNIKDMFELLSQKLALHVRYRTLSYGTMMGLAFALESFAHFGLLREPLLTRYGVGLLATHQTLDITHAKTVLGYVPKFSIEEGMERYASWRNQAL